MVQNNETKFTAEELQSFSEELKLEVFKNSDFLNKIVSLTKADNIQNDNANVDEKSFSGRKLRASGELHKFIALNSMISQRFVDSFNKNEIYFHDLDSYDVGQHNCTFIDLKDLLNRGFQTRNGDVRKPTTITTAYQLVAVLFQVQSQVQFGGVGSAAFDYELSEYVAKSFIKQFNKETKIYNRKASQPVTFDDKYKTIAKSYVNELSDDLREIYDEIYAYAMESLEEEIAQATEGLIHNLNTLESRGGCQLPFTSINLGLETTEEGRLITKHLFQGLMNGIGKYGKTSIFPIAIFRHKKGVNAYPSDPNYDLKQLAIKCLSKRIYPNYVNCDVKYFENDGTPQGDMATMG